MWEGLDLNKFVVFLAALLCVGILCACGDGASDDASSGTAVIDSIIDDSGSAEVDTDENDITNAVPDDTGNIDALARELIADISNGLHFSKQISYIKSAEWLNDSTGYITKDEYIPSSDETEILLMPGTDFTITEKTIDCSSGGTIQKSNIWLAQILYVPKESFPDETELPHDDMAWLNEKIFRIQKPESLYYYVLTNLGDDTYDCVLYFVVRIDEPSDMAAVTALVDHLFLSMTIRQIPLVLYNDNDVCVLQYDHETLWIVPADGKAWILNDYTSDADFFVDYIVSPLEDGLISLTVYDRPNSYAIVLDPDSQTVIDEHMSIPELAQYLGQDSDYIDCVYKQYCDGATAYFLYDDRIVKAGVYLDESYETVTPLLYTKKPEGEALEEFYQTITQAIIYLDPNARSYTDYFMLPDGKSYHIAESSPFSRYDSYKYYLSCIFTDDSTELLMNWSTAQGDPYIVRTADDYIYFLATFERGELVCDIEDMILVDDDGVWKCDLVESLKQTE